MQGVSNKPARMVSLLSLLLLILAISVVANPLGAQQKPAGKKAAAPSAKTGTPAGGQRALPKKSEAPKSTDPRKDFVLDVLKSAIAVPQSDPQDGLRVLATAVSVATPVDLALARDLAQQGVELETRVIVGGQVPVASVMDSGQVKCPAAQQFVDALPAGAAALAQKSLVGALQACSKVLPSVEQKLDVALANGTVAPRALLAAMQAEGNPEWTQREFEAVFKSLPKGEEAGRWQQASELATLYAEIAPRVGDESAAAAGVRFLEWANTLPQGGERNLAVNVVAGAMREVLGPEKYQKALSSNITAAQVAQSQGEAGEADTEAEDSVSVLGAMGDKEDRTSELEEMPDASRAREAAAHGFARGSEGDLKSADKYFDIAFSAVDRAWDNRRDETNSAAIVEEVCEAAAQVDPLAALRRAQQLQDSAAKAIGMLAVARVVLNRQQGLQPMRAAR